MASLPIQGLYVREYNELSNESVHFLYRTDVKTFTQATVLLEALQGAHVTDAGGVSLATCPHCAEQVTATQASSLQLLQACEGPAPR